MIGYFQSFHHCLPRFFSPIYYHSVSYFFFFNYGLLFLVNLLYYFIYYFGFSLFLKCCTRLFHFSINKSVIDRVVSWRMLLTRIILDIVAPPQPGLGFVKRIKPGCTEPSTTLGQASLFSLSWISKFCFSETASYSNVAPGGKAKSQQINLILSHAYSAFHLLPRNPVSAKLLGASNLKKLLQSKRYHR